MPKDVWKLRAACLGTDSNLFLQGQGKQAAADAKAMCNSCTVSNECLDAYLKPPLLQDKVIAGGLTYRERFNLARALNRSG